MKTSISNIITRWISGCDCNFYEDLEQVDKDGTYHFCLSDLTSSGLPICPDCGADMILDGVALINLEKIGC